MFNLIKKTAKLLSEVAVLSYIPTKNSMEVSVASHFNQHCYCQSFEF